MSISLTPQQQAWIEADVARGEFVSINDGVRPLIDGRIAERSTEADDLQWARPC